MKCKLEVGIEFVDSPEIFCQCAYVYVCVHTVCAWVKIHLSPACRRCFNDFNGTLIEAISISPNRVSSPLMLLVFY